MSNLITDNAIYIIESKFTKLQEKEFYCGTNFLNTLKKLEFYNRYKKSFVMEKYLQPLCNDMVRKHLSAFRLVSHRLEVEIGRHNNIPRDQR